jgi:quercetin 2,3-dioxygenase
MTQELKASRRVARVVDSIETREGGGFLVRRPFPTPRLDQIDPFLLLDEMGPVQYAPGQAKGAPDHPHRGFETVTYLLEGAFEHKDSRGNSGRLGPGDVQWMTAGSGVIHSEMPAAELARTGGQLHGFQLWVNLPRRDKMTAPRYQEIPSARIPEVSTADGAVRIRVIAGEALGARAVIETRTPILYLHVTLVPGARFEQPVPHGFNSFAYVIGGDGRFGEAHEAASRGQLVLFDAEGESVTLEAPAGAAEPVEVLLLAGAAIGEPVARYGPFVMNTREEIYQAVEDYNSGRFGSIDF